MNAKLIQRYGAEQNKHQTNLRKNPTKRISRLFAEPPVKTDFFTFAFVQCEIARFQPSDARSPQLNDIMVNLPPIHQYLAVCMEPPNADIRGI